MDTPYNVIGSKSAIFPASSRLTDVRQCWLALLEWWKRPNVRESLRDLTDRELQDIGIARSEIDLVASNRAVDLRII